MTEVGLVRSAVIVVSFSEDKDIFATTEGVFKDGGWTEVNVGVMTWSLVG